MGKKVKEQFCPFSEDGCETETQRCCFYRPLLGCELEALIKDLRSIPNLLRHIENKLEEGKQIR